MSENLNDPLIDLDIEDSYVEQRQSGFIVLPSENGDTTPDNYPNGGPLDVTATVKSLDLNSGQNPFKNSYYGQMVFNEADNSFYFWSKKLNRWKSIF